ncbi:BNR repeat-containing protein [Asticcacaulis machinosus]|uniref:BNR repeat-containing protein n=1 Tax=Asticcacaulis machinosus TaxID=2984211 RepID=A0ABT5HI87_9CAUL|nr:BNR repeat-containing protein [Asticcacaulis machinosus]MDC7675961.1 BNR repeat-containing protein [Asticcacaulis machinosus]
MLRLFKMPGFFTILAAVAGCTLLPQTATSQTASTPPEAIDRVWSGHSVDFALLTTQSHIYAAYYDANRQLTVAQRPLNNPAHWVYHKLDTWLGWDSHNFIAMEADSRGAIHVAANMHVDPLTYFRSAPSGDVRTLTRVPVMVSEEREGAMTYPVFLKDKSGRLIFKYRDGTSGRGNEVYNLYDDVARTWAGLTSAPLVDGEGQRNAYFEGPVQGSDGYFHMAWVWRDSPHAETNHDLSYARSSDLISWQTSDGKPLTLPIKLSRAEIVDPVPVRGGMINGNTKIGFDDQGRVMITYHKYDGSGFTQIWVARREAGGWVRRQISSWRDYRWDFKGTGSLDTELFVEAARAGDKGRLIVPVMRLGQRTQFEIDANTLKLIAERPVANLAQHVRPMLTVPDDMRIRTISTLDAKGRQYVLAWATRPPQRDRPSPDIPDAGELKLFVLP